MAFYTYSIVIYPTLCYFFAGSISSFTTDAVPLIMPYSIMIAGMHWITTTKAQKPRKSRISGPLTNTLLVTPEEARAAVLVTRLMDAALNNVDKAFMAFLLLLYVSGKVTFIDGILVYYFASVFASVLAVSPLTSPVINITAGISWPTTITAKKPRKIHTKIPLPSSTAPDAANAVTGAMVPTMALISALMTSSYFNSLMMLIAFVIRS